MTTASSLSLMKSADLIKKEPLDYGGFGEVYLCYHKTLGQVVLKTVYTGPPRNGLVRGLSVNVFDSLCFVYFNKFHLIWLTVSRQKQSLLDEGSLMSRLNHERVVKLLGVILEDGDYSLVMELIPKGNLLTMLETVSDGNPFQGHSTFVKLLVPLYKINAASDNVPLKVGYVFFQQRCWTLLIFEINPNKPTPLFIAPAPKLAFQS